MQGDPPGAESKQLQRCVSDLIGITALQALWVGRTPSQIAASLLDAIDRILDLDVAHIHLNDGSGDMPLEATKLSRWAADIAPPEGFAALIAPWRSIDEGETPRRVTIGGEEVQVQHVPLGLLGQTGWMLVGSRRPDFARETERLLLNVAANQATISLQAAWRLSEQARMAGELDRLVEAGTRELALANEELRRRELDFQLVVDSIPAPVAVTTPTGEIEGLNRSTIEYFGKSVHEMREWQASDIVHPDDFERQLTAHRNAHDSGDTYHVEVRFRRHDGVYRWFRILGLPLRDPRGKILRWFHMIIDIDDGKRAQEALAASERNLAQTIDTIPVYVWSAGADGGIEYLNRHYLDYLGARMEDVRGWSWSKMVHPDDLEGHLRIWRELLASGSTGEWQTRLRRFDGEYRWFLHRANPLRDSEGQVRWFGVTIDIEDLKRAEDRLRQTQADLAHINRAMTMGQITASIAHELNQPLAGIMTNAATALRMLTVIPLNVDGARETARRTIRDARRASDVIARLRELFARRSTVWENVDLNGAAQEVLALSMKELQRRNVACRIDLAANVPPVIGDRVQLQQVILNFLLNAADAMNDVNGRPHELTLSTSVIGEGHVVVRVSDSGVGFDPAVSDKLFTPFYTTKREGMGIGLSVSRSIIENHQGRVWGERNEGPGSTFGFSIPSASKVASAKAPPR